MQALKDHGVKESFVRKMKHLEACNEVIGGWG